MDRGGDGCLGCGVGAGYLHVLPHRRRSHLLKEPLQESCKDGPALPPQPARPPPTDTQASAPSTADATPQVVVVPSAEGAPPEAVSAIEAISAVEAVSADGESVAATALTDAEVANEAEEPRAAQPSA